MSANMTATGAALSNKARHVISAEEAEKLDKTLNVLAGRTDELRERLTTVLVPSAPKDGSAMHGNYPTEAVPAGSILTDRFRNMRITAETAIHVIDDILSRLDV